MELLIRTKDITGGRLRSFFGAIEDWNWHLSIQGSMSRLLRSFFGAIEDWNNMLDHVEKLTPSLRSFFGAIEDWNLRN